MAEFIFKALTRAYHVEELFYAESAAVSTEEIGNGICPPAKQCLRNHGVVFDPEGFFEEMEGLEKVAVVGGGVGCAIAYTIAQEMHEKGIDVTFIAGFRSADIVILKDELKAASNKLIMCTDDGSYGEKGFGTVKLQQLLEKLLNR